MWMLLLNLALLLGHTTSFYQKYATGNDAEVVRAHVGMNVSLPCRVDTKKCGQLHSVKWYKDTDRVYVLSQAGQGRSEADRIEIEYKDSSSVSAGLTIFNAKGEDEATYKCEITYLEVVENCDVVQIVTLKILKKPDKVEIHSGLSNQPIENSTLLGPYRENDEVDLTCWAYSGKPIPSVKWYNGTREITRAIYAPADSGGGFGDATSILHLTLTRGDLLARFECRVDSEALDEPIISWISIDVNVRPTDIDLSGLEHHVVQGTNVKLDCVVRGARPEARIWWTNGTTDLDGKAPLDPENPTTITTSVQEEKDGTYTTISSLSFKARHWENGKTIYCHAENDIMLKNDEPELRTSIILDVRYPPVITVKPLNTTVNETTEAEATNVFLQCVYFANPQELIDAAWLKDGRPLDLTDKKYVGGTKINPPLYINQVRREDMGEYSCSLTNEIGTSVSEDSIFLNVQYTPEVEIIMEPSTPVKAVDRTNVSLTCNVTSGNPSSLLKVRWISEGEVMKELPECNYTSYDENGVGIGNGGPFCSLDPSYLLLERVQETFAGNYTCMGKNVAGWGPESQPQELIVYYPPSAAKIRFYPSKVVKGGSVTLECEVEHPGRPDNVTYLWFRGNHQMADITTAKFTVSPVRLETRSNFTCIAANEGGKSNPASVYVDVNAPPSFIKTLKTYQGVLYNSKHINLTCRVECFPECLIVWKKDGHTLNTSNNPLYYVKTTVLDANLQTNDFESIESTLIWNMTNWPNGTLNKNGPNSHYTCQATANSIGPGVSSEIEIAVDYPPDDLNISPRIVHVDEHEVPATVRCHGKGHPALSYQWRKNLTSKPIGYKEELRLEPLTRADSGQYICIASNKYGNDTATVYFNVQYAPECSIATAEKDGNPALVCSADANPQEVIFIWKVKELNETFVETNNIKQEGLKSYLFLDSSIDTTRTYICYVNNTVGLSHPCERTVAANLPWWKQFNQDRIVLIIASIIAIILVVIIICIIIILLCRRKRADTKYNNPLEMEERENPDGHAHEPLDQSKWPLQPGLLVQVNKMNTVSISQLAPRMSPYKITSVSRRRMYSKYKRRKYKMYDRLARLKELFGIRVGRERLPFGIKEGENVVTFRKVSTNPPIPQTRLGPINSRKRKKPGAAPPLSSIEDKGRLGSAAPLTSAATADPSSAPPGHPSDPDKGFYENLPFHGMQNPPNKPISVIAPFTQGNTSRSFTSSTKSLISTQSQSSYLPPFPYPVPNFPRTTLQRHQSFHGFQNPSAIFHLSGNPTFMGSQTSNGYNAFIPSIFSHLPQSFNQRTGARTISGIPINTSQSYLPPSFYPQGFNPFLFTNPFSLAPQRVVGRNEAQFEIRRSASGINKPEVTPEEKRSKRLATIVEKRFGSLDIKKKHRCYSPTFYSMRCKKHAKKRPIIVTLPKKCFSELALSKDEPVGMLKDSCSSKSNSEIFENNQINDESDLPVPAPRCRRYKKTEIVYANISQQLNKSNESNDTSADSNIEANNEISITEVQVHATKDEETKEADTNDETVAKEEDTKDNKAETEERKPVLVAVSPKGNPLLTPQALKNSPVLKVSPNFIKPKTESPKGALSLQIQAKLKASPLQSPTDPNKKLASDISKDEKAAEQFPSVPQMPVLSTASTFSTNTSANSQNAFYTLNPPHFKQLTSAATEQPPQYSATIPHQHHHQKHSAQLLPKALFQEPISKSKSFNNKSKQKKHHFQIPLQKCNSFKFQTAESYFQPIKNLHEENLMRNGYASDYQEDTHRRQKREKHKKAKGPLVLRRPGPGGHQESVHFQVNMQNSIQLQYPQPVIGQNQRSNGVVYADLDMPSSGSGSKQGSYDSLSLKNGKKKSKTEYATLKFDDVGQEIDV